MNEQTNTNFDTVRVASPLYLSPQDVLDDPTMTVAEKRELLASWASDARAVTDAPALRQLDNGAIVLIDDVLEALKQLDRVTPAASATSSRNGPAALLKFRFKRQAFRRDDDDDPPPCPVAAGLPRPLPILDAACAA